MSTASTHFFTAPDTHDAPGTGVRAHWYRPTAPTGPRAGIGVVVLPIQGGDYEVSRHFAEHFVAQGFHVLRFERRAEWLDPAVPIESVARLIPAYVADVRAGIAWWREALRAATGGDAAVALFGVSMGAMMGTLVLAEEPEIRRAVLCIGGGNLADILVEGRDAELDAWRDAMVARVGGAEAFAEAARTSLLPHDVLPAAARVAPRDILFVAARFDRVVPWSASVRLWTALGRPRRMTLPTGHYSAAVAVPWIRWAATRWLAESRA